MEPGFEERHRPLRLSTLAGLFGDYAHAINRTNELGHDIAETNGCYWADAFEFQIPREVLLAELARMESWMVAHEPEMQAAREAEAEAAMLEMADEQGRLN